MRSSLTFSIVINNYNYAAFLRSSIDSALGQTWTGVQVVVVDDGSTDNSREVIHSYGDKIISVYSENAGQGSAYNHGFARAKGDVVCFLDADDMLHPEACRFVAAAYRSECSKVQGKLRMIQGPDWREGGLIPFNRTMDVDIYGSAIKFYYYSSPPGSGNFYSRSFLDVVMPMPPLRWRISADAYLIGRAPFHGRVVAVENCLGFYRIHSTSASAGASAFRNWSEIYNYAKKEYVKEMKRKSQTLEYYHKIFGRTGNIILDTPSLIKFRLLLCRGRMRYRFKGFYIRSIFERTILAAIYWRPYNIKKKIAFVSWVFCMLFLPRSAAFWLARKTTYPYSRGY